MRSHVVQLTAYLLRTEAAAVLGRVDEDKDHVPQIARVGVQGVYVVLIASRVGIAAQEAEVLD